VGHIPGLELYRGTQHRKVEGVRAGLSYTTSLPAAIVWSSVPPDKWGQREAEFLPTSTVHVARLNTDRVLELAQGDNHASFASVLMSLEYGDRGGISQEEATKILQYMHNRIIGKAKGGEFVYRVYDEEGELFDDNDLPFSLTDPLTGVSEIRDAFECADNPLETAGRLIADTFIFADAPAVQRAAIKMGYEAMFYWDLFQGAEHASKQLLGIEAEHLKGVEWDHDIDGERTLVHETYRVLVDHAVIQTRSVSVKELLRDQNRLPRQ